MWPVLCARLNRQRGKVCQHVAVQSVVVAEAGQCGDCVTRPEHSRHHKQLQRDNISWPPTQLLLYAQAGSPAGKYPEGY